MKKSWGKVLICLVVLLTVFTSLAMAKTKTTTPKTEEQRQEEIRKMEKKQAELRTKTHAVLQKLYVKQPKAKAAIASSYGYAVFVNSGYKLGIIGTGHGRGIATDRQRDKEYFMRMEEYQAGLGLGATEYALVFVMANKDAWKSFVMQGWSYGGQASASATDSVNGDALEGAFQVAPGIWVYQLTTKGLSLELALKGNHFYLDKDMNY